MKETFEQKLARVAGTTRHIEIDNPHRRYSDGMLYWSNKAERLHDAALVLGGDPFAHHFEAFALLAGFSLETLIKGTLTGLAEKIPFTHDLANLFECAGFPLSDDDRAVVNTLTVYTTWYSRYPAAKTAKQMMEGMEILQAQHPTSGNALKIIEDANTSPTAVNAANYDRLYGFCLERFHEVRSSVIESVRFSFESRDD
jgi:HEPN domain-containing protein